MTIIIAIETQTFAHRIERERERFNGGPRTATNARNVAPLWVAANKMRY